MDTLLQDLRFSARTLLRRPGFTLAVALTLALGIGANTAIFSFVNGVLLRPLPYREPGQLVRLWTNLPNWGHEGASYPDFVDWRDQSTVFERVGIYTNSADNVAPVGGDPERVPSARADAGLFPTLGVTPILGRAFTRDDEVFGAHRVVILSHALWQRLFNGDSAVVGQTVTMNAVPYTVIGVAPPAMRMPAEAQLWAPHSLNPANPTPGRRNDYLSVIARLKPGVTEARAQTELDAIARRLAQEYPQSNEGVGVDVVSLHGDLVGPVRTALLVFAAAVGVVLLIACANIANLLLARATGRGREMAVRVALGAGRRRLVRQLLTESVLLALAGGALGTALAVAGVRALKGAAPPDLPRLAEVGVDPVALAFAVAVSLVTGLLFGLAPALRASSVAPAHALSGGRGGIGGGAADRLRSVLVFSQVGLTLVLLTAAGLLVRSFQQLQRVDLGFTGDDVLTAQIVLPAAKYAELSSATAFYESLRERVAALPGVRTVGYSTDVPLDGGYGYGTFSVIGRPQPGPGEPTPDAVPTTSDAAYFSALRIPLVEGRLFGPEDRDGAPRVALVNQEMVRKHFNGKSPIGERLTFGDPADTTGWMTVVGVVGSTRLEGVGRESYPQVFRAVAQSPTRFRFLVVRTNGEPLGVLPALRREVAALDPTLPLSSIRTMEQRVAESVAPSRLNTFLVGIFAAVALVLASVGIYGVLSYAVAQRTREIGVRVALGATAGEVLRLVVRQGMTPVAIGVAAGLLASFALTRLMTGLLYDVSATDPLVYAAVTVVLLLVATAACIIPARRATRVDPVSALRLE